MSIVRSSNLKVKHPGAVFKEKCLDPHGINITDAAKKLHISRKQLSCFINGNSSLSIELAKKLEFSTGISVEFWVNRQKKYDLYINRNLKVEAEPLYACTA